MLNSIILMGRLTKEPSIFEKEESTAVVSFDLAVDNLGKDAGTTFITCKAFGKVAQNVNKFCEKGSKVAVAGRPQQRNFLKKDGSKGNTYEVLCDSVEFLDPKPVESFVQGGDIDDEPELPETKEYEATAPAPKFDPYTGELLKPAKKK